MLLCNRSFKKILLFAFSLLIIFSSTVTTFAIDKNVVDNSAYWYDADCDFIYDNNEIIGTYKIIRDQTNCCYYVKIEISEIELCDDRIFAEYSVNSEAKNLKAEIDKNSLQNNDFLFYCVENINRKYNVCKFIFGVEFKDKEMKQENCLISVDISINGILYNVFNDDVFDLSVNRVTTTSKPKTTKETTVKQTTTKREATAKSTTKKITTAKNKVTSQKSSSAANTKTATLIEQNGTVANESSSLIQITNNLENTTKSKSTNLGVVFTVILLSLGIIVIIVGLLGKKAKN